MSARLFALLVAGCGTRVAPDADASSDADGEATTIEAEASDDAGTDAEMGVQTRSTMVAWIDDEQRLQLSIANHDSPTCADPSASKPADAGCVGDKVYWVFNVVLYPPFAAPGEWDGLESDQINLGYTSAGPGCAHALGGLGDVKLRLEALTDVYVAGTVAIAEEPEFHSLAFTTPLCP